MGFNASMWMRLSAVALMMAVAAGCGGGGGGDPAGVPPPADPPAVAPLPAALNFGMDAPAAVVIGQGSFTTSAFGSTLDALDYPTDVAVTADGRLIVNDVGNSALKVYRNYDAAPIARAADFQLLRYATSASSAGGKVAVVEGNRVLIFNSLPAGPGTFSPDAIAGTVGGGCGANALWSPSAAHITPLGRLVVADEGNHRVLIWNTIPESGLLPQADVVIGQDSPDRCASAVMTSGDNLRSPKSVWSDDKRLLVSDSENNRVLVWNSFPDSSRPADVVIGQVNFEGNGVNAGGDPGEATLAFPWSMDVNPSGQLVVSDHGNHRVLIWNAIPERSGQAADQVIGQPDFKTGESVSTSARSTFAPQGVRFHGRNLIISIPEENRVLIWRALD